MWSITRGLPILVDTEEKVRNLKDILAHTPIASLDTETTGLEHDAQILFWSLSTGPDRYCLERKYLPAFRSIFEDPYRTWVMTNAKYDARMFANAGIELKGEWYCTLIMDHLLDSDEKHGLKEVYTREFNEPVLSFAETFFPEGMKKKKESIQNTLLRFWEQDRDRVVRYASLDAWMTFRVFERLQKKLENITTWRGDTLWEVFSYQDAPFTKVLFSMEQAGILIDTEFLEKLKPQMERDMEQIVHTLSKVAGEYCNPASSQQVSRLLFDKLRYRAHKFTPGGAPTTNEAVLEPLAKRGCQEAKLILEYRALNKMLGTYVNGLLKRIANDGRLHTQYNQAVARTYRLSSSDPNLQNIPTNDPYKIRQAFISRPGYVYFAADYEQLEMYITAHFSEDQTLLSAIRNNRDLHASTAAEVWSVPYGDIIQAKKTDPSELSSYQKQLLDYRQHAKVVNFGLIYGQQEQALAEGLGLVEKIKQKNPNLSEKRLLQQAKAQAKEIRDLYFRKIPGVCNYLETVKKNASEKKYVETWSGRRRWLRYLLSAEETAEHQRDAQIQAVRSGHFNPSNAKCYCDLCRESRQGERQASNTPIQGTAADITQGGMLNIYRDKRLAETIMILQVHDEVGLEVPEEIVNDVKPIIVKHLENPGFPDFRVPLRASVGVGKNWLEAK